MLFRSGDRVFTSALEPPSSGAPRATLRVNVEASFGTNARAVEDDHIDLEWFSPQGQLLWSTMAEVLPLPLHVNLSGETVRVNPDLVFRQVTERVQVQGQVLGYLRVSHPWFEVSRPSRRLMVDLALGTSLMAQTALAHPWNHGMAKSRSGPLRNPDALLEPMPAAELASWDDASLLPELPQP